MDGGDYLMRSHHLKVFKAELSEKVLGNGQPFATKISRCLKQKSFVNQLIEKLCTVANIDIEVG